MFYVMKLKNKIILSNIHNKSNFGYRLTIQSKFMYAYSYNI